MIPAPNASLVLPPFIGDEPGSRAAMSPYVVSMEEVVVRFATSLERIAILRGLLSYRKTLRDAGLDDGHQWLDGSFVEDVEAIRKRPPRDIDIVTFASVPGASAQDKRQFMMSNSEIFDPTKAKTQYFCDAYFVDLSIKPILLVDQVRYWFGLFSHQRETSLWKGMLQVPTISDDLSALQKLDRLEADLRGQ